MSDANAFDYIAFNQISGEILSHGATAAQAALMAEVRAQTSVLMIVKAGRVGIDVWEAQWPYPRAAEALWLPVLDRKIRPRTAKLEKACVKGLQTCQTWRYARNLRLY